MHQRLWKPMHIEIVKYGIFLFGFGLCCEYFVITGYYGVSSSGYIYNPEAPVCFWAEKNLGNVYPFISLLINVGSLTKLIYMRMKKKSHFSDGKPIEFNLFMICLASLFVQLALLIYVDFGGIVVNTQYRYLVLNVVSDFGTLSEAWIGLMVNRTLRQRFFGWLLKRQFFLDSTTADQAADAFQRAPPH
ncbi:unnamed protein product, partial [Mesorhabditis belari]|uniref:Uncharacterized protein n=1 Tax=Mesorhabditis belari TaxID=2138241 RepID=A0AAF3EMN3_9BILA